MAFTQINVQTQCNFILHPGKVLQDMWQSHLNSTKNNILKKKDMGCVDW